MPNNVRKTDRPVFKVTAVGTDNGKAVLFLHDDNMREVIVPTDIVTMSKLAELGVRIRNV